MSQELQISPEPTFFEPRVDLHRIERIVTYEVMERDLREIEDAAGEEKNALAFATASGGAVVGAILGWPADGSSATRMAIHISTTAMLTIVTLWFGLAWRRKRQKSASVLEDIRSRTRLIESRELPRIGRARA